MENAAKQISLNGVMAVLDGFPKYPNAEISTGSKEISFSNNTLAFNTM